MHLIKAYTFMRILPNHWLQATIGQMCAFACNYKIFYKIQKEKV